MSLPLSSPPVYQRGMDRHPEVLIGLVSPSSYNPSPVYEQSPTVNRVSQCHFALRVQTSSPDHPSIHFTDRLSTKSPKPSRHERFTPSYISITTGSPSNDSRGRLQYPLHVSGPFETACSQLHPGRLGEQNNALPRPELGERMGKEGNVPVTFPCLFVMTPF